MDMYHAKLVNCYFFHEHGGSLMCKVTSSQYRRTEIESRLPENGDTANRLAETFSASTGSCCWR